MRKGCLGKVECEIEVQASEIYTLVLEGSGKFVNMNEFTLK